MDVGSTIASYWPMSTTQLIAAMSTEANIEKEIYEKTLLVGEAFVAGDLDGADRILAEIARLRSLSSSASASTLVASAIASAGDSVLAASAIASAVDSVRCRRCFARPWRALALPKVTMTTMVMVILQSCTNSTILNYGTAAPTPATPSTNASPIIFQTNKANKNPEIPQSTKHSPPPSPTWTTVPAPTPPEPTAV